MLSFAVRSVRHLSNQVRPTWFEDLFGFPETPAAVYANFRVTDLLDHVDLTSMVNSRTFNAGHFSVRTLDSFVLPPPPRTPGIFNIIRGKGATGSNHELCNVLETQSLPEFDGSTFQAASTFACLEFVDPWQTALKGITGYADEKTQGPALALAAAPAAVYRNYFVKHASGAVGQIEEEVQLLAKTPLKPYVVHGYPLLSATALESFRNHDWSDRSQYLIGLHENCEVTTTIKDGRIVNSPKGRITHQVYVAALNFNGDVFSNEISRQIGLELLKAQYEATILAAWEMSTKYPMRQGAKRLILTALGGGVFANPMDHVCEAVLKCGDMIMKSGLTVYFTCFDDYCFVSSIENLKPLVDRTGGRIIESREEM
jgi:hypothetical protein